MFLNDYGARWYNPQLNQWHQIDPLAENYYALSSYNYVANNPIKYIDPDGREFIGEFDTYRTSIEEEGLTSGEVPGCPECDPIGMLQEVLITATRLIGPQTLEEQLAYLEETKEIREENQNTMYPLPQATGSLDVDNSLVQLFAGPEDVVLIGGAKLLGFVPIILRGVKWGAPVGKVTYGAAKTYTKSSLKLGREVHAAYRLAQHAPKLGRFKEFTGIKGIRPDFVDFGTKTIYELKPFNPNGIKMGTQQLEKYKALFEQTYGGTWKTVLDLY